MPAPAPMSRKSAPRIARAAAAYCRCSTAACSTGRRPSLGQHRQSKDSRHESADGTESRIHSSSTHCLLPLDTAAGCQWVAAGTVGTVHGSRVGLAQALVPQIRPPSPVAAAAAAASLARVLDLWWRRRQCCCCWCRAATELLQKQRHQQQHHLYHQCRPAAAARTFPHSVVRPLCRYRYCLVAMASHAGGAGRA
jgi:hypothetical protein